MKKFTFKGVLDGFRQTVQPQAIRQEQEVQESLKTEHFALRKVILIILIYNIKILYYINILQ